MRRDKGAMLVGIGIDAIFFFLPSIIPNMPMLVVYIGLGIGTVLFLVGLAMFFWPSKNETTPQPEGDYYKNSPRTEGDHHGDNIINPTYQYFPPQPSPVFALPTVDGKVIIKHEKAFDFFASNETSKTLSSAVYVDEVSYTKDGKWIPLINSWSGALQWRTNLVMPDGFTDIDDGKRLSFVLLLKSQDKYFLVFDYDSYSPLPNPEAKNHRLLIRFVGRPRVGIGIDKKAYIFISEQRNGIKQFVGFGEYDGE